MLLAIPSILDIAQTGARTSIELLTHDLGACRAEAVAGFLFELADDPCCHELHLDLRRLECLGAAALGLLVDLHHRMSAKGGGLTLDNVAAEVYEIFEVTRLTQLLDIGLRQRPKEQ